MRNKASDRMAAWANRQQRVALLRYFFSFCLLAIAAILFVSDHRSRVTD